MAGTDDEDDTDDETAMDKAELKVRLRDARSGALSCAIGYGTQKDSALILIDKVRGPRAVLDDLEGRFPKLKLSRFGSVRTEKSGNGRKVVFELNKELPNGEKRLLRALRGTGYTKVEFKD